MITITQAPPRLIGGLAIRRILEACPTLSSRLTVPWLLAFGDLQLALYGIQTQVLRSVAVQA